MQEKINGILEYCQIQGYYTKVWNDTESLKKIHIANKYLQKLSLKVLEDSKVRILTHENNRFSQEITKLIQSQQMEILPYHYDAIILPDTTKHIHKAEDMLEEEEKQNSQRELERIISIIEKLNPNDEVKIYTNYKGIISALKNSRQTKTRYAGTLYETIYDMIKDKQLFVHFEWVKGGVLRKKKRKESEPQPKIGKKLLIR